MAGDKRIPIVGIYLPPSSLDSLPELEAALDRFPGQQPVVLGDLNVDLMKPTDPRSHDVAAVLASYGMEDMLPHFLQHSTFRHNKAWWQKRNGRIYRSRCDYVLGNNRRLFKPVSIRDPRHYSSDHYVLKGRLLLRPKKSHKSYLKGPKHFPLKPPTGEQSAELDSMFATLKSFKEKSQL